MSRNLAKYHKTIEMAIACGCSNRTTAKLMNALFADLDLDLYVSEKKIRLLKAKYLKSLTEKHEKDTKGLIAVGMDGKCGLVKTSHCQSIEKDKQTMIVATTGDYLDHEIPEGGTAEEICNAVYPVSNEKAI